MRKLFVIIAVALALVTPTQAVERSGNITANGQCVEIQSSDTGNGSLQITGTWTGTISFTASNNGVDYQALNVTASNATSAVTSTTSNGLWVYTGAFRAIRACATASITGTATVRLISTWARAGGGGGGSVTGCAVPGSDTQVMFNDGGSCGAEAGMTYNKATDTLSVGGLETTGTPGAWTTTAIAAPSTPAAGKGAIYEDSTTKRLSIKDDAGIVTSTVNPNMVSPASFIAAGCNGTTPVSYFDLPVTPTPAAAICVAGTNVHKGALSFPDTANGFTAQVTDILPSSWTTTGGTDISLYWYTTATSGNVKWTVSVVCTPVDATATDDPTFATSNSVTTAVPGTGSRIQTSTITGATLSSCTSATKLLIHIKIFRNGGDAADTAGATVNLVGMELVIRRAI